MITKNIKYEAYYINDKLHRIDGPAVNEFLENGFKILEKWVVNGKEHRVNGEPSTIKCDYNGNLFLKKWCVDGKLHRERCPAIFPIL